MRRKELFYYVTSGSNVMRDMHWSVTVDFQQIENGNMANQIHGFTIDYGKFILIADRQRSGALLLNWKLFLILCLEMHKIVGVVL